MALPETEPNNPIPVVSVAPETPVPTIQTKQPSSSLSTPTPGNSKALLSFLLIFVVLILGVGGYASWQYFNPAPEKVMRNMREAVLDVDSFSYNAQVVSDAVEENTALSELAPSDLVSLPSDTLEEVNLDFSGVADLAGGDNKTSNFSLDFSFKDNKGKAEIFSGSYLTLDDTSYLKLNNVESSDENLSLVLSVFKDSWLDLSDSSLEDFDESGETTEEAEPTISVEDQARLDELFLETDFFKVTEKFKNEKVNSVDCFHYAVELDKEAVASYGASTRLYSDEGSAFDGALSVLANTEAVTGDIWIGKKDFLPQVLLLTASFEDEKGTARLDLSLDNYNQSIQLQKPEKVMTYMDFISAMFDAMLSSTSIFGISEDDLDGDGLTNDEEIEFGSDQNLTDTDGDNDDDLTEWFNDTDPNDPNSVSDDTTDSEVDVDDPDGDLLTNSEEAEFGSDPNLADTDGDGLDDLDEWFYDADPTNSDTDGDGVTDGVENNNSTDPTDPESY